MPYNKKKEKKAKLLTNIARTALGNTNKMMNTCYNHYLVYMPSMAG